MVAGPGPGAHQGGGGILGDFDKFCRAWYFGLRLDLHAESLQRQEKFLRDERDRLGVDGLTLVSDYLLEIDHKGEPVRLVLNPMRRFSDPTLQLCDY